KTYLNMLKNPIMFVIQMNPREKGVLKEVKDYIVNKVENDPWGTGTTIGAVIISGVAALEIHPAAAGLGFVMWLVVENSKPILDNPGDNNLIVGDGS
ncbi:hypothetical protein, partial [Thermococcus sp.]